MYFHVEGVHCTSCLFRIENLKNVLMPRLRHRSLKSNKSPLIEWPVDDVDSRLDEDTSPGGN
jgi:hypothetical protein